MTQKKRRRRKRIRLRIRNTVIAFLTVLVVLLLWPGNRTKTGQPDRNPTLWAGSQEHETFWNDAAADSQMPEELRELALRNAEAAEFVSKYPDRAKYIGQPIDLREDVGNPSANGKVPLFLQWDLRWGYESYGSSIIALSGCGPTCLSMAYVHLTGDTQGNPREMAQFAQTHGYYASGGTSWKLWTDGAKELGLSGQETSLDEAVMKRRLDAGNVIVCSVRPGDFTTTGHFILIYGYDKNGFFVNDPNSKANSSKTWKYETLAPQIKNLWALGIKK